jgi:zinc transport system ATP-binding protein
LPDDRAAALGPGPGAATDDDLLACERLVIGHDGEPLLPPLDFSVRRGQFVAVIGRNGSGKSTWLKTALGLIPPVSGRVRLRVAGARVAYVPQAAGLDPILPLGARDVVLWGRLRGWSFLRPFASAADRARRDEAIAAADAQAFARRRYGELSEGQKQRTLFARMLATDADLALLDEPTAAMDMVAEREVMDRLANLAHERGMAIVLVGHFLGLVSQYADTVLFLDADAGVVVTGPPAAVFADPAFRRRYGDVRVADGG